MAVGAVLLPTQLIGMLQRAVAEQETAFQRSSSTSGGGSVGGSTASTSNASDAAGSGARLDMIGHSMALVHLPPYASTAAAAWQQATTRRGDPPPSDDAMIAGSNPRDDAAGAATSRQPSSPSLPLVGGAGDPVSMLESLLGMEGV